MQREMRRKDRQITQVEAKEILIRGEYGVLSTVGEDNLPYGIPISYVVEGDTIYVHSALKGRKVENFQNNPKVSFCVVGSTKPLYQKNFTTLYESALVFGEIGLVEEREEKTRALTLLCEKYLPEHRDKIEKAIEGSYKVTAVYRIIIDTITGKAKRPL